MVFRGFEVGAAAHIIVRQICWTILMDSDFQLGDWRVQPQSNSVVGDHRTFHLEPKMMGVLLCLAQRSGEVVSKEQIVHKVWEGTFVTDDVLVRCVSELRKVFSDNAGKPTVIETIPKRGYRLLIPAVPITQATVIHNDAGAVPRLKVATKDETAPVAALAARRLPSRRLILLLGVVLSVACLVAVLSWIHYRGTKPPEPVFQRISFGRGTILSARFAPDGQSVVYGAAWDGKPFQLFYVGIGSSESLALGVDADILAISPAGEMAVLLDQHFGMVSRQGTLALMSLTGRAPRKLLDNVQDADWSPDGSKLAVTHYIGDHCALEFPPGKVLYETTGGAWLSAPRISPRGDQIAFLEHPLGRGDDAGYVAVIDLAGNKTALSRESVSVTGLAWDPAGNAIWFSGSERSSSGRRALFNVTIRGQQFLVRRESNNMDLHDVSRDGHLLLTRSNDRGEVFARIFPENAERELGWHDYSVATDVSADGSTVLLSVQGESSGTGYEVYLRKADGSPAVRLGDGLPQRFSPDGKWVLTDYPWGIQATATPQLVLLPTGAGQPVTLTHDAISHHFATFLPYGKKFLFEGSEPGHALRNWVQDVEGGKPIPITPEGTVGKSVSPDGKFLAAVDAKGKFWLYPIDGGQPRELSGIEPGEETVGWSGNGKDLFVANCNLIPVKVYRIGVSTARRQLVYNLAPSNAAGLWGLVPVLLTPDAKSYIYSPYRVLSDLYVASGLR